MLYSELVSQVIDITNRPDFSVEISRLVLKSTEKLHLMEFWPRDRRVDYYTFNTASFIQELNIREVFPRWRAFSFLRKYNPAGRDPQTQLQTGVGQYPLIDIVDPEQLFDEYYSSKVNVAYLAGDTLSIRSSDALKYILVGWYQKPLLVASDAQFNSWIAEAHPYAIIDDTIAALFKLIGYDEQSRKYEQLNAEHIQMMRTNNITAVGY